MSLAPVRTYLTALTERRPIDETLLWQQKNALAVQSAVASDFGAVKIRDLFRPAYDQLLASGVQLRDDDASDLSHNKYMVVDAKTVWMGSYNIQGLKSDDGSNLGEPMTADNAVVLSSPTLAAPFLADFKQMFEEGRFHGDKSEISGRTVTINGVKVTPYFAPKDPIIANITADLGTLLNRMRAARESGHPMTPPPTIRVAGFAMSYNGTEALVDMLALLHREGADVQVISDGLSAGSSTSSVKALRERGVPVMVTDAKVMMHHKFLSVEAGRENYVFTGSANFTHPAYFDNDESVLRLESQKTASRLPRDLRLAPRRPTRGQAVQDEHRHRGDLRGGSARVDRARPGRDPHPPGRRALRAGALGLLGPTSQRRPSPGEGLALARRSIKVPP